MQLHLRIEREIEDRGVPAHRLEGVGLGRRPGEDASELLQVQVILQHPALKEGRVQSAGRDASNEGVIELGLPDGPSRLEQRLAEPAGLVRLLHLTPPW